MRLLITLVLFACMCVPTFGALEDIDINWGNAEVTSKEEKKELYRLLTGAARSTPFTILSDFIKNLHSIDPRAKTEWEGLHGTEYEEIIHYFVRAVCPLDKYIVSSERKKEVLELLARDGDIDARDSNGRTALMHAAIAMDEPTLRLILKLGADLTCVDNNGDTALSLAADWRVDIEAERYYRRVHLDSYIKTDKSDVLERYRNIEVPDTVEGVVGLIQEGAPIQLFDREIFKDQAFAHALWYIREGFQVLKDRQSYYYWCGIPTGGVEIASTLIDFGADLDVAGISDDFKLAVAAYRGDEEATIELIKKVDDVDAKHIVKEDTALMYAAWQGHPRIVEHLLDAGADPNKKIRIQYTYDILHCAIMSDCTECVRHIMEHGFEVNEDYYESALTRAIYHSSRAMVELLYEEYHFSQRVRSGKEYEMFYNAIVSGNIETLEYFLSKNASYAKSQHVDIGPVHYAYLLGNEHMVPTLLAYGAENWEPEDD